MLNNLEILNGEISPEFDSLNNIYSVNVDNSVDSLIFDYDCQTCEVEIINNDILLEGLNEVIINVYSENEYSVYTFLVTREESETVFSEVIITEEIENSTIVDNYHVGYLIALCIILILIMFKLLFIKRKVVKL